MLLTGALLGAVCASVSVSGLGWSWWRRWRPRYLQGTHVPLSTQVASGTLVCIEGAKGELIRLNNHSEFTIVSACYKGRDVTRFMQEGIDGVQAWEFRVSDDLFAYKAESYESLMPPRAALVVEWKEVVHV